MGIINMTPDSFSADGCLISRKDPLRQALLQAQRFVREGADILDVGGESSRPGAPCISVQEEISRVVPAIRMLARKVNIPLSVDTYKPPVAQHALDAGATIVNTIMGIRLPKSLLQMVRRYNAAVVLMHMRGKPKTMQKNIRYKNLVQDIIEHLSKSVENCLEIGIKSDRIIIDPGIGFGKTVEHNLEILNRLREFSVLKKPILIGASRKSFIGKVLGKDVSERLWGSLACVCAGILNGAHIVRVHDVGATKEIAAMTDAILNPRPP
ncbi:MAG: dihydropteroate synthase [Omnitrophica WOR_2 bacterium RIFCSPLOWO2_12_FULL_50_9]|nr:MAG: dihydropteroate synthase [Omnitrophica WOR_2 bacterium RIFCSPHIGHO2_02_FULL_50_17]OGX40528.1 MAG: dihydropteroate synthase [Omnitrophica WOR_2 bacterium RIFCSPLOWO2_12_FULL_50_9]